MDRLFKLGSRQSVRAPKASGHKCLNPGLNCARSRIARILPNIEQTRRPSNSHVSCCDVCIERDSYLLMILMGREPFLIFPSFDSENFGLQGFVFVPAQLLSRHNKPIEGSQTVFSFTFLSSGGVVFRSILMELLKCRLVRGLLRSNCNGFPLVIRLAICRQSLEKTGDIFISSQEKVL